MAEQDRRTLLPGYKQVQEFGQDDEYESEEEVSYVTLDLGSIEPTLVPSSSTYRLIGLDTPTPFLQLSGTIFRGKHDSLLGSELIFTDDKANQGRARKGVAHVANTEQRIIFREVQLRPKDTTSPPAQASQEPFQPANPYEQDNDREMDTELLSGDSRFDLISSFEAYGNVAGPSAISSAREIQSHDIAASDNMDLDEAGIETGTSNQGAAIDPAFKIDNLSGISMGRVRARRGRVAVASGTGDDLTPEGKRKGKEKAKRQRGEGKENNTKGRQEKGKQRAEVLGEREAQVRDGDEGEDVPMNGTT